MDSSNNIVMDVSDNVVTDVSSNIVTDVYENVVTDVYENVVTDVSDNVVTDNVVTDVSDNVLIDSSNNVVTENIVTENIVTENVVTDVSDNVVTDVSDNVVTDNVVTDNVVTDVSDNVVTENVDNIVTENIVTDNIVTENVDNVVSDNVVTDNVVTDNVATDVSDNILINSSGLSFLNLDYPKISSINQYTNVLLIDIAVPDYQIFVDSANASTIPITYSVLSTKTDLLALLQTYFTTIPRIGICFTANSGATKIFLDNEPFFIDDEQVPYSANMQFILDIITEFQVKNIDYLACNTLGYPNWKNYYDILLNSTGVTVGASSDQTGNIFYGGDWVLESTNEDIELLYFTENIEYYTYLLDTPSWATSTQGLNGGIGIDFYNGYFYVCNYNNNTIVKINANNASDFTSPWFYVSLVLAGPPCIRYYGGYFFVANLTNNTITQIDANNPASYTASWANNATQGINGPIGITVYNNYLYIPNNTANTITKINPYNNADFSTFATLTAGSYPRQIVYYNGYFYVSGASQIIRISTAGTITYSWATTTQGLGTAPDGMVVYGNSLYVTNIGTNPNIITVINITNPTTQFIASWATSAQGLSSPRDMILYGGYLYVTNYSASTISQITCQDIPFWFPYSSGFGLTSYNGYLYASDSGSILKISLNDPSNNYSTWAAPGTAWGLTNDGNYLYFADPSNSRIGRISFNNPSTDFSYNFANSTQGANACRAVTVYNGYLYVSNNDANTVSKISANNPTTDFTASFATSTRGLNLPFGLDVYNGYLYVANRGAATVSKISLTDPTTDYVASWATSTQGLNDCRGLIVFKDYVYVTNGTTNLINKLNVTYPTLDYSTLPASTQIVSSVPYSLAVSGPYLYAGTVGTNAIAQLNLPPFYNNISGDGTISGFGSVKFNDIPIYYLNQFNSSGTTTITGAKTIYYVVIGGGGAGFNLATTNINYASGGGGSGGIVSGIITQTTDRTYTITIGAGGATAGASGTASSLAYNATTITANGGGGGSAGTAGAGGVGGAAGTNTKGLSSVLGVAENGSSSNGATGGGNNSVGTPLISNITGYSINMKLMTGDFTGYFGGGGEGGDCKHIAETNLYGSGYGGTSGFTDPGPGTANTGSGGGGQRSNFGNTLTDSTVGTGGSGTVLLFYDSALMQ